MPTSPPSHTPLARRLWMASHFSKNQVQHSAYNTLGGLHLLSNTPTGFTPNSTSVSTFSSLAIISSLLVHGPVPAHPPVFLPSAPPQSAPCLVFRLLGRPVPPSPCTCHSFFRSQFAQDFIENFPCFLFSQLNTPYSNHSSVDYISITLKIIFNVWVYICLQIDSNLHENRAL